MPEPEIVGPPSQPFTTGTQQQSNKCRLNQLSQKIWKQLPVYQTLIEGPDHQPKFRTTVWVGGVSYTSPNTFRHRKLAELDASNFAYFAIMKKLKTEALHHVYEDKTPGKSILFEFAVRMNKQKPTFQTTQLESTVPVFRTSLVFDEVTYTGDECSTKKEADKSALRTVSLKYLDSKSGNILSEIINSKFNHLTVTKDVQTVNNDTNGVNVVNLIEAKGDKGTKQHNTSETHVPQIPSQTISMPIDSPLPTPFAGTNNAPTIPEITHIQEISTDTSTQTIEVPTVLEQIPTCNALNVLTLTPIRCYFYT